MRRIVRWFRGKKPNYEPAVFKNYGDVPISDEDIWKSSNWIEAVKLTLDDNIVDSTPSNIHQSDLVTAMLYIASAESSSNIISVIDIGGGVGVYYPRAVKAMKKIGYDLRYAVVDGQANCEHGRLSFRDNDKPLFFDFEENGLESAIEFCGGSPVINIASTIHYIPEWRRFLADITSYQPPVICISRFPSADNAKEEAFAVQNIYSNLGYCGKATVLMLPGHVLISEMKHQGYECIIKKGVLGDSNWYWDLGCADENYYQISLMSYVFVKR